MPKKSVEPCAVRFVTFSPLAHPSPLSVMKWMGGTGMSGAGFEHDRPRAGYGRPLAHERRRALHLVGAQKVERPHLVVLAPPSPVGERVEVSKHFPFGRNVWRSHAIASTRLFAGCSFKPLFRVQYIPSGGGCERGDFAVFAPRRSLERVDARNLTRWRNGAIARRCDYCAVIPDFCAVIPAKAGIQRFGNVVRRAAHPR